MVSEVRRAADHELVMAEIEDMKHACKRKSRTEAKTEADKGDETEAARVEENHINLRRVRFMVARR